MSLFTLPGGILHTFPYFMWKKLNYSLPALPLYHDEFWFWPTYIPERMWVKELLIQSKNGEYQQIILLRNHIAQFTKNLLCAHTGWPYYSVQCIIQFMQ